MIFTEEMLRYNPERDVAPVMDTEYIDLVAAFDNRVIPSDVAAVDLTEMVCEDTEACFDRPRDIFDLYQQNHAIAEAEAKKKELQGQSK